MLPLDVWKEPAGRPDTRKTVWGGSITVKASLKNSRIEQIRFEGDFLGCMEMKDIEQLLNGVVYERDAVSRVFEELDIRPYFGTITKEEVVSCIMGDDRI
ncbi:MAG: lipoate protein ligase C-terminal domain-containing protein [Enterocloster sp.]